MCKIDLARSARQGEAIQHINHRILEKIRKEMEYYCFAAVKDVRYLVGIHSFNQNPSINNAIPNTVSSQSL